MVNRILAPCLVLVLWSVCHPANAGNAYVLPDGLSRAPAVTLHCVIGTGTAIACGTPSQPIVVTTVPAGGALASRSLNVPAGASTTLFAANPNRHYFGFQAPQASAVWINFLGGAAGPNLPDCAYFPAESFYESGQFVNRGAITVYTSVSMTISAWEG
jgi:hypothetical protein